MLRPMRALLAVRERRRRTRERFHAALGHTVSDREELSRSDMAGCVFCLHLFNPQDEELQYGGRDYEGAYIGPDDALCPGCGFCGGLIGSARGYPITLEFMTELNEYINPNTFFGRVSDVVGNVVAFVVISAVVWAPVLAIVLAVIYLPLRWERIFLGLFGLAVLAFGVAAIVKREVYEFDPGSTDPIEHKGFAADVLGIGLVVFGLLFLAMAVLPWE